MTVSYLLNIPWALAPERLPNQRDSWGSIQYDKQILGKISGKLLGKFSGKNLILLNSPPDLYITGSGSWLACFKSSSLIYPLPLPSRPSCRRRPRRSRAGSGRPSWCKWGAASGRIIGPSHLKRKQHAVQRLLAYSVGRQVVKKVPQAVGLYCSCCAVQASKENFQKTF